MTQPTQPMPKVIVVAEQQIFDVLAASGAGWDLQHRVDTLGQMWDDLSGGRLDQSSSIVVFSDLLTGQPGELESNAAVMAPSAATFVVNWEQDWDTFLGRVAEAAAAQNVDTAAPIYRLPVTSAQDLLSAMHEVLGEYIYFPAVDAAPTAPVAAPQVEPEPVWTPEPLQGTPQPSVPAAPYAAPQPPAEPVAAHPTPQVAAPQPPMPPVAATPQPEPSAPAPVPPVAPHNVPPASAPQTPQSYPSDHGWPATVPATTPPPSIAPTFPTAAPPEPQYAPPAPPVQRTYVQAGDDPTLRPPIDGQVTIAVTSSKGGSGKSTTALELASCIAHASRKAAEQGLIARPLRVVLVDMDTRDGQVGSLIAHYVPTALNIRVAPQWDEATILKNLVRDERLGIDALLAPVRPRTADDVGPDFYRHVIRSLQRTHDVVIMDTSVNYLDKLISTVCLPEATAILFVTTLATTSVQGMARALREITTDVSEGGMGIKRSKIGIVVNQSVNNVAMERDQVLSAALKVPIVGAIPLATRDVLTATNSNRMHLLLKHPLLGPAYFKLAKACMPRVPLVPLVEPTGPDPTSIAAASHVDGAPATNLPVAASQAEADSRKRGLFGRGR